MDHALHWSSILLDDVTAWAQLSNHLAVVDGTEEFFGAEDRAEELESSRTDPEKDTLAVWDGDRMIAFGKVWVPSTLDHQGGRVDVGLDGGVHADYRGRGVGAELMGRLEARGAELAGSRHSGVRYYFSTGGGLEGSSARAFHLGRGYEVARYFSFMGRALTAEDSAESIMAGRPLPEGVAIRAPKAADERAVFDAHAAAFVDHWGSAPPTLEVWHERWRARSNRHAVSRIAVDEAGGIAAKGSVLAYSLCAQWVDRELYVNLVGTVPSARGRGLGSAVLAHSIEAAARGGDHDVIELDVDSESPTGATRLYERLGFTLKHTQAVMRRYPG